MYVDEVEFFDWARHEIVGDQAYATRALVAAETRINYSTGRRFNAVGADAATARVFEVDRVQSCHRHLCYSDTCTLIVDDCTEITSIVGAATESAANYRPIATRGADFGLTWPYDTVRHISGWVGHATWGYFTVTAKWGWVATPEAIKEAAMILAKDIATNRDVRAGLLDFGEGAIAGMRRNPTVVDICRMFHGYLSIGVG